TRRWSRSTPTTSGSSERWWGSSVSSDPGNLFSFARSLDQELAALLRGASLQCLVCGEFVMHARPGVVFCPECGCIAGTESAIGLPDGLGVEFFSQAG